MNINVGNLVKVNLGFFRVDDSLQCERKFAWGIVKEILTQTHFKVHFIEDGHEFVIKRHDIKTVFTENGQNLS